MRNNKGFTLIELIVVIAIMSVIAGISSMTMSSLSNQELKDFVNNYDAMLSQCKVETISGMPDPELRIVRVDGEYRAILYKKVGSSHEVVKSQYLGEDYLTCTYDTKENAGQSFNGTLSVSYDRTTGTLKDTDITKVSISNGRTTYSVELIPETGYHRILR